jgi:sulfide:quinone oxidoreductase
MSERVVILGAGFGGLELSTPLSQALGDEVGLTLIDKDDAFAVGFSKFDAEARRLSGSHTGPR